jgi:hypothetical protein
LHADTQKLDDEYFTREHDDLLGIELFNDLFVVPEE